jgi:hypothetical protein
MLGARETILCGTFALLDEGEGSAPEAWFASNACKRTITRILARKSLRIISNGKLFHASAGSICQSKIKHGT